MQFIRKTSSRQTFIGIIIKSTILLSKKTIPRIITRVMANFVINPIILALELVFFINCIYF